MSSAPPPPPSSNKKTLIIAAVAGVGCFAVVVVLVIAAAGFFYFKGQQTKPVAPAQPPSVTTPASPTASGGLLQFGNGRAQVQLAPGWTGATEGKSTRGHGPGGVAFEALTVETTKPLDRFMNDFLEAVKPARPGLNVRDTDDVQNRDGLKGKLVYYQYEGQNEEVDVAFQANGVIAMLVFSLPANSVKRYQADINAMLESVQIGR